MNVVAKYPRLVVIALMAIVMNACEKDVEPENDPGNTEITNPDEASEYLVFTDANKITGSLPSVATDGQLRINFKDTIYVVKDFEYSTGVIIRHDARHDITGVFLGIPNSSFYFDVPVSEGQARDSVDVIYIDLDIPPDENVAYPFTIPIKIIPHGPDNVPIDEFEKFVTIEDSEKNVCPITWDANTLTRWQWEVSFTNITSDAFIEDRRLIGSKSSIQSGGCCNTDGSSSTVADDPTCFEKYSDGSLNPSWRSLQVNTYHYWVFDYVWFFDDGTFKHVNASTQTNYRPSLSDFCNGVPAYDNQYSKFEKSGTYELNSQDYLKVAYNATNPPVYGKGISSGEIQFVTCHYIILYNEVEGGAITQHSVFSKVTSEPDESLFAFWYD